MQNWKASVCPGRNSYSALTPKGEALVEVVAEVAVVIDVDRHRVVFVPADEESVLADGESQFGRGLPAEIQEVRGVEHIALVENFFVKPLADAEIQLFPQLSPDV